MMRFKSFFLVLGLTMAKFDVAGVAATAFKPIRGVALPVALRAVMPRGARTWFYGKAPAELGKQAMWLHFYSFPGQRSPLEAVSKGHGSPGVNPSDYVLSIWERNKTTRSSGFRRTNFIRFSGEEFFNFGSINKFNESYLKIKIYLHWLHRSPHQIPIVRINAESHYDNASISSDDVLFIFKKGLGKRPHIQQFNNYSFLFKSAFHNYEKVDRNGLMFIEQETREQTSLDDDSPRKKSKIMWDGNDFVFNG